jgi:hypothetical protein
MEALSCIAGPVPLTAGGLSLALTVRAVASSPEVPLKQDMTAVWSTSCRKIVLGGLQRAARQCGASESIRVGCAQLSSAADGQSHR